MWYKAWVFTIVSLLRFISYWSQERYLLKIVANKKLRKWKELLFSVLNAIVEVIRVCVCVSTRVCVHAHAHVHKCVCMYERVDFLWLTEAVSAAGLVSVAGLWADFHIPTECGSQQRVYLHFIFVYFLMTCKLKS